jgi:hypothetical protein
MRRSGKVRDVCFFRPFGAAFLDDADPRLEFTLSTAERVLAALLRRSAADALPLPLDFLMK